MSILEKYDILEHKLEPLSIPELKELEGIVLLVGSSGSGKTTILKSLNNMTLAIDSSKTILENFSSEERAEELLIACGLRSIPSWIRTINEVSNGERHRAEIAIALDKGISIIDEFTSVVDRNTAKSLSYALRKNFDRIGLPVLYVASCHSDIIEWLMPDWIYNTDTKELTKKDFLRRPDINIQIRASSFEDWVYFKRHHYLDSSMSKSVHCYTEHIDNNPVAFLSVTHGCGRDIKSYWRESRLVVIPEFQGLGIGYSLSCAIAEEYIGRGLRYFSKTSHPAMGEKRNTDIRWRATSTNMMKRKSYLTKEGLPRESKGFGKVKSAIIRDANRLTYSHEYIGDTNEKVESRPA